MSETIVKAEDLPNTMNAVAEYDLLSDDDREEIDEDDDGEEEQAERNVEVKDEREENKQDEGDDEEQSQEEEHYWRRSPAVKAETENSTINNDSLNLDSTTNDSSNITVKLESFKRNSIASPTGADQAQQKKQKRKIVPELVDEKEISSRDAANHQAGPGAGKRIMFVGFKPGTKVPYTLDQVLDAANELGFQVIEYLPIFPSNVDYLIARDFHVFQSEKNPFVAGAVIGCKIVVCHWLINSFNKGQLLDDHNYYHVHIPSPPIPVNKRYYFDMQSFTHNRRLEQHIQGVVKAIHSNTIANKFDESVDIVITDNPDRQSDFLLQLPAGRHSTLQFFTLQQILDRVKKAIFDHEHSPRTSDKAKVKAANNQVKALRLDDQQESTNSNMEEVKQQTDEQQTNDNQLTSVSSSLPSWPVVSHVSLPLCSIRCAFIPSYSPQTQILLQSARVAADRLGVTVLEWDGTHNWNQEITHVLADEKSITSSKFSILLAAVHLCRVIDIKWLIQSAEATVILPEREFLMFHLLISPFRHPTVRYPNPLYYFDTNPEFYANPKYGSVKVERKCRDLLAAAGAPITETLDKDISYIVVNSKAHMEAANQQLSEEQQKRLLVIKQETIMDLVVLAIKKDLRQRKSVLKAAQKAAGKRERQKEKQPQQQQSQNQPKEVQEQKQSANTSQPPSSSSNSSAVLSSSTTPTPKPSGQRWCRHSSLPSFPPSSFSASTSSACLITGFDSNAGKVEALRKSADELGMNPINFNPCSEPYPIKVTHCIAPPKSIVNGNFSTAMCAVSGKVWIVGEQWLQSSKKARKKLNELQFGGLKLSDPLFSGETYYLHISFVESQTSFCCVNAFVQMLQVGGASISAVMNDEVNHVVIGAEYSTQKFKKLFPGYARDGVNIVNEHSVAQRIYNALLQQKKEKTENMTL